MQILKIEDSSYQIQRVNIDNQIFNIQLSFNSRDEAWYIDIFDINSTALLQGQKLQWGSFTSKKFLIPELLSGDFYIFKTDFRDEKLGRNNLGVDKLYQLVYLTDVEIVNAINEYNAELERQQQNIETRAQPLNFLTSNESFFITNDLFVFKVVE